MSDICIAHADRSAAGETDSDSERKPAAVDTTTGRRKSEDRRQCICAKPDCKKRRLSVIELVDADHA